MPEVPAVSAETVTDGDNDEVADDADRGRARHGRPSRRSTEEGA